MKKKDKRTDDAADLRKRAEEEFRADDAKTKKKLTPLVGRRSKAPAGVDFQGALKETRKMLHELRVHQIELEMQNENLRRAQAELDAARTRYFDLYDLAPVGYCTVSEQGLILEANLTAAKLLGLERKQLVKQPLTSFIHNEDQDVYYLHRKQLFESGAPQVCELRMLNKEGNHFWVRLEAAVAQDADGALVGRVVLSDITERKQAEAMLRKNTQLLMDTGEMAQVGGWELDLSTKEVLMTEEISRIHGVEPGYRPKLEEALNFYTPESRPEVEAVLKKAAETGEPYDLESLFIPQGSKEKIWVRSIGRAVYSDGKITKLAGTFQNIDKYKRVEETLRESEEKFRTLVENAKEGILIAVEGGVHMFANRAATEITGYNVDELLNLKMQELAHPDEISKLVERLRKRLAEEPVPQQYETTIVSKNGMKVYVEINCGLTSWHGQTADIVIVHDHRAQAG